MYVLSLFSRTGLAEAPWLDSGVHCVSVDLEPQMDPRVDGVIADASNDETWRRLVDSRGLPGLILSFPPCTDLARAGARWWPRKAEVNPSFQADAIRVARTAQRWGDAHGVPWLIENPVGRLSTGWRRPDVYVQPCDFGGYLEPGPHPLWPRHIPPMDAYTKKTGLWVGCGFQLPVARGVEPVQCAQMATTGGGVLLYKTIRSATPRGLAVALFEANRHLF